MTDRPKFSRAQLFAAHAGTDLNRWRSLVGQSLRHWRLGSCVVIDVVHNDSSEIVIRVEYGEGQRRRASLLSTEFLNRGHVGHLKLKISDPDLKPAQDWLTRWHLTVEAKLEERRQRQRELEAQIAAADAREQRAIEKIKWEQQKGLQKFEDYVQRLRHTSPEPYVDPSVREQRQREAEDRKRFAELKRKYSATRYPDESPSSHLFLILLSLESGEELSSDQRKWLEHQRVFGPLAHLQEVEHRETADIWCLVHASRLWRRAGAPSRALAVTEKALSARLHSRNTHSALLTTRGGAFRDLKQFLEAEQCARKAIELQSRSWHAYNLLGAIYYDQGRLSEGDEFFQEAVERGAPLRSQENMVRTVLNNLTSIDRRTTAEHLLKLDPERYAWASHYLQ